MKWLTIFTPTYNRAKLLKRLYTKLKCQTEKSFIWLIVDDGSTDNTKEVIDQMIKDSDFEIRYIYQSNSGKQRAVNTALDNCNTMWFAFCDSDDWYLETTVSEMKKKCEQFKFNDKVCGIVARRGNEKKECKKFPKIKKDEMIINLPTLYVKYKFHAETCAVFKTNALKFAKYPYINNKFIPESYMFNKYSQKYDVLFINKVWSVSKYLSDGLTMQSFKLYHDNPIGVFMALKEATYTYYGIKKDIKNQISLYLWMDLYDIREKVDCRIIYKPFVWIGLKIAKILKKPEWIWYKK